MPHWRPTDLTRRCVRTFVDALDEQHRQAEYEEFLCLYPGMKRFITS
jgi:hypothetical protein